ncbi:MAG: transcriptional regulator [Chlorobi bacterium]|nr:transcriptional regulator [Chlorobiota bacterium]
MEHILKNINKAFDNRVRLGIMSILSVNDGATFTRLKELLGVTDGNLASHLKALEKEQYVSVEKTFVGRKPQTTYRITQTGREAFKRHIEALEKLIGGSRGKE